MWKYCVVLLCLSGYCLAGPVGVLKRNIPIGQQKANDDAASSQEPVVEGEPNSDEMMIMSTLTLPSNATSIRADITDNFSCNNKTYGYYADVDNDCQIFHVCLPVTYADGKENTFRWSFICPEETVFSQDSFTCMRPEDMIISCEESFKYYELNNNFGNAEQESEKEMDEMPASEVNKPSVEAQPEVEATEAEEPLKPVKQPVKVQKPNRRKPGPSYAVQKKPSNSYPLRKIPQPQPQLNSNVDGQTIEVKETVKPLEEDEEEEEITPVVQKLSRRPVSSMTTSFKDKMHNSKTETVNAIRSDLYNQKRKRPTMFNKKPIEDETEKTQEGPVKEESPATAEIPEQTNFQNSPEILNGNTDEKVEAESAKEESPAPAQVPEQTFFQMAPDMSNANTETQVADAEIQASETNEVLVKPQEVESPQVVQESVNAEEPQVLEAIEEIPAVIAEVEETAAQSTDEEPQEVEEIPEEPDQTAEESQAAEEISTAEENQASQEMNSVKEPQTDVEPETIEENIQAAEEPEAVKFVENAEETQPIEESQAAEENAEEPQMSQETAIAAEVPIVKEAEAAINDVHTAEEPEAAEKTSTLDGNQTSFETQAVEEDQVKVEDTKPAIQSELAEETEDSQEDQVAEANESQAVEESLNNEMVPAAEPDQSADEVTASAPEQPAVVGEATKQVVADETVPADEPEDINSEVLAKPEQEPTVLAEPSIFEEKSEETAGDVPAQTIEEMEEERPAEAPESMPATEEMTQQDPIIEQMFEETNDEDNKQTLGGFKPVDPVMAAEAEQLIADFINTLRKNEFVNEKPGTPMEMPTIEQAVQEYSEDIAAAAAAEESAKLEEGEANGLQGQVEQVKDEQSEEISSEPQIVETQVSAEESKIDDLEDAKPSQEDAKPEQVSTAEEVSNVEEMSDNKETNVEPPKEEEEQLNQLPTMAVSNTPQEIYEIPVQVITNPLEEIPQEEPEKQAEDASLPMVTPSNNEEKQEGEAPAVVMDGYKPLSIDDIVELVKERLDHMPKDKMETPMQLEQVLSEVKPNVEEEIPQADDEQAQESQQPEEEIVMPIYHRTVDIGQVDTPVQDESAATVENTADPIVHQEKSTRFYRSRSMLSPKVDPRKRRFLFRSDAS